MRWLLYFFLLNSVESVAAKQLKPLALLQQFVSDGRLAQKSQIPKFQEVLQWSTKLTKVYKGSFVSGEWRTNESSHPEWKHAYILYVPKKILKEKKEWMIGFLGNGHRGHDSRFNRTLCDISEKLSIPVMQIFHIPNQPIRFEDLDAKDYKKGIWEDRLIAYGWDKFLKTKDPMWLPRYPMVRAGIVGFDQGQKVLKSLGFNPKKIVTMGGSKRGWTTWLTPLVDPRIQGIIPVAIDILNVNAQLDNHQESLGFWSEALNEYRGRKIIERRKTAEFRLLLKYVDPFSFRKEITVPKLIISGANDPFFMPNSSQFYFPKLLGEKNLRYLPNNGHVISGFESGWLNKLIYRYLFSLPSILNSVVPFVERVIDDQSLPKLLWNLNQRELKLTSNENPVAARLYVAENRSVDFRFLSQPFTANKYQLVKEWTSDVPRHFRIQAPRQPDSYQAFFVELEFFDGYRLTSPVYITQ